ncbi:MAG: universal stress protein [Dehalococcoidia bacterium]|nr:universal stress protein [Dehalococcoidia bacterium]
MDIGKILVPVTGNPVDADVLRIAGDLADVAGASVYAVYVMEIERSLPLDVPPEPQAARAEEVLSHALSLARDSNHDIETGILQAREAGPAIVHEAAEGRFDLVVMGMGHRRRPGAFEVGDTVSHVLRDARCGVLLYRERASGGDAE